MEFGLLGPLLIRTDAGLVPVTAAKRRVLLAALLLKANSVVSIDQLVEYVWGEAPPPGARATLHTYMTRLRRTLGTALAERVGTRAPGYLMEVRPGELDLDRFQELHGTGLRAHRNGDWGRAARDLRAALELWRGDPLLDIPSDALQRDEVGRLAELRLQALEWRIDAEHGLGRFTESIAELRQLAAAHPFHEAFPEQLMTALYNTDRTNQALAVFQDTRRAMVEELGTEPGPALRELHQLILSADPALAGAPRPSATRHSPTPAGSRTPAPAQLPRDIADFTGREQAVSEVAGLLGSVQRPDPDPGTAVLISAVTGSGGIGKTALAVHVAHRLVRRYPDGQLFLNLRGAGEHSLTPGDALDRLLRGLGVDAIPTDVDQRSALFRSMVAGRRVLVVLDDARDSAQVRPLLPGSPTCAALVTSRNRLAGLAGCDRFELGELEPTEAAALFARIVGVDRVAAEPGAAAEVVSRCAGLPLAVRVAAARLAARPDWTVRTLADRLADHHTRLDELEAEDLAVRACLAMSYASLRPADVPDPADHARTFRLLGGWQGPTLSRTAAPALLGLPDRQAASALEHLVDVHLLESAGPDRYRFHDLVRLFAAERARQDEDAAALNTAVCRLLYWYLHTALAAQEHLRNRPMSVTDDLPDPPWPPLTFADRDQALAWCDGEFANLVAAVRQADEAECDEVAGLLPMALQNFFQVRSHWREWIASADTGLRAARRQGRRDIEARLLNSLGIAHSRVRRFADAIGYFTDALAIRREIGDRTGEAASLLSLGAAHDEAGRPERAIEYCLLARALFAELGNEAGEAICVGNLAWAYRGLGRLEEAVTQANAALRLNQRLGDQMTQGNTLTNLGVLHHDLGRLDAAADHYRQALVVFRELGHRFGEADVLYGLAEVLRDSGQIEAARACWQDSYVIFQDLDLPQSRDALARLEEHGHPAPKTEHDR